VVAGEWVSLIVYIWFHRCVACSMDWVCLGVPAQVQAQGDLCGHCDMRRREAGLGRQIVIANESLTTRSDRWAPRYLIILSIW
jgi:hypothetical protein